MIYLSQTASLQRAPCGANKCQQWLLEIETPGTMEHNLQEQFAKTDRTGRPLFCIVIQSSYQSVFCVVCGRLGYDESKLFVFTGLDIFPEGELGLE